MNERASNLRLRLDRTFCCGRERFWAKHRRAALTGVLGGWLGVGVFACSRTPSKHVSLPGAAPAATVSARSVAVSPAALVTAQAASQDASVADPFVSLFARAETCLLEPMCAAEEADRLFQAADDASEPDVACLHFADANGTKKDVARARRCLERTAGPLACEGGSSASLALAELTVYRIDGLGGPQDVRAARAALLPCADDLTRRGVLDHADAKEKNPATAAMNFCKDYGGTTLTSNECVTRAKGHDLTRAALQAKTVFATLDANGKQAFIVANEAYAAYVAAMGAYVYEVSKDGSVRNVAATSKERDLLARRTSELSKLTRVVPKASANGELTKAAQDVDAALSRLTARAASAELKASIAKAQAAWLVYRDAEVAFYVNAAISVSTDALAKSKVADAARVRLAKARASDLQK